MDDVQVARFEKNRRERYDVRIRDMKDRRMVDLRVYAENGAGDFVPTAKGIAIKPSALRDVIQALEHAERLAIKEGTIEPR